MPMPLLACAVGLAPHATESMERVTPVATATSISNASREARRLRVRLRSRRRETRGSLVDHEALPSKPEGLAAFHQPVRGACSRSAELGSTWPWTTSPPSRSPLLIQAIRGRQGRNRFAVTRSLIRAECLRLLQSATIKLPTPQRLTLSRTSRAPETR